MCVWKGGGLLQKLYYMAEEKRVLCELAELWQGTVYKMTAQADCILAHQSTHTHTQTHTHTHTRPSSSSSSSSSAAAAAAAEVGSGLEIQAVRLPV